MLLTPTLYFSLPKASRLPETLAGLQPGLECVEREEGDVDGGAGRAAGHQRRQQRRRWRWRRGGSFGGRHAGGRAGGSLSNCYVYQK